MTAKLRALLTGLVPGLTAGLALTTLLLATCWAETQPGPGMAPILDYSQHILGPLDRVNAAAVGVDGSLYLAGVTLAKINPVDVAGASAGEGNAFVAHFSADGSKLLYLTYVDKSGLGEARSLKVDEAGNVFVTGATRAANFPVLDASHSECSRNASGECRQDAFVVELDRTGAPVFARRLGATGDTAGNAIALDSNGNIFVGGSTNAYDFATSTAAQTAPGGSDDGFVASLSADGSSLRFVSYLGGSGTDDVRGLAIANDGGVVATGSTTSFEFPTRNALQSQCPSSSSAECHQAFVTKLSSDGSNFEYSTYLGGSGRNSGNAIAVDANGNAYVAGTTNSTDFPMLHSLQSAAGSNDAFVAKIAPDGSAFVFATLLGGKGSDRANAVVVEPSGRVYVAGSTQSPDFPIKGAIQPSCAKKEDGSCTVDGFVAMFDSEGKQLQFSSYLGGHSLDLVRAIAVDSQGSAYLVGWTTSPDFPVSPQSHATKTGQGIGGNGSSFVAKLHGAGQVAPQVTCGKGTNNWTGTAGDNQWTTATNWSTGAVPVSKDNVCIASSVTHSINVGSLAAANQTIASLNTGAPLAFTDGPLTISGTSTFAADLAISNGTWTLGGASSMTTLELSAGVLAGSGAITTSGLLTWSGGSMCTTQSSGSCTAPASNATTTANGGITLSSEPVLNGRTLTTAQTTNSTAFFEMLLENGAVINNQSGATWSLGTDFDILNEGGTGTNTFNNAGTFQKTGGTSTSEVSTVFNNNTGGSVSAGTGTLTLNGSGSGAGNWAVSAGAALTFSTSSSYALSGGFSGAGAVNFQGGTVTLSGAANSYAVTGTTTVSGATTTFSNGIVKSVGNPLTISGGVADFQTNVISVATMNMSGGIYAGSGALTISGALTWSGGSMCTIQSAGSCTVPTSNAVTGANGGITLSSEPILNGRTLNTSGTSASTAFFEMLLENGAIVNNQSGATWTMGTDFDILNEGGTGTNTFNNAGTFTKTGGTSTSQVTTVFNNNTGGSVSGGTGTMTFSAGGSGAGKWSVSSNANVGFTGGSFTLTGSFSGAGTFTFQSGTVVLSGAAKSYNVTGATIVSGAATTFSKGIVKSVGNPLTISGGIADFQTNILKPKTMTMSGGIYTGSGTLTITGALTWSGGSMCTTQSAGACTAPASNATTDAKGGIILSSEPILNGRTLNTSKTSTNNANFVELLMENGAVINNLAKAKWTFGTDFDILNEGGTGTNTFNNAGSFTKTGGTSTSQVNVVFNNNTGGTVSEESGTLSFEGGGSGAGNWAVSNGALTFSTSSSYTLSGTFSGAGTVNFQGGTVTLSGAADSYDVTGSTTVSGATTTFSSGIVKSVGAPLTISGGVADFQTNALSLTTMTMSGGTYAGSGALTISGAMTWSGGSMCTTQSAGNCTAPAGNAITDAKGGITLSGEPILNGRTLNTSGTSASSAFFEMLLENGAIVNNQSSATWTMGTDFDILNEGGTGTNTFNNAGTFTKTGGTSTSQVSVAFNNSGPLSVASGTLSFEGAYTQTAGSTSLNGGSLSFSNGAVVQGGSFTGSGSVTGSISNPSGTLAPGTSTVPGTITLTGTNTYSQGSGGSYSVKVGGTGAGQFDTTVVGGAASLGGALNLTLINGFTPTAGTQFTVMTFASKSGQFASVSSGWSVSYTATSAVAKFTAAKR